MPPGLLPRPGLSPTSGARVVPVLIVLVFLGSALSLGLALSRPDPGPPTDLPGSTSGPYVPVPLAGPGASAIASMGEVLPSVLGYDYRSLDRGLTEATAVMTRSFADDYRALFDSSARRLITRQRSVIEAQVKGIGQVRVLDDDTVLGLAYVDQVLVRGKSLSSDAEPRVQGRFRVLVELVAANGGWKIANMSPV